MYTVKCQNPPQSVILNSKPIQNHLLRLESLKFIIKNFPLIIPLLRLYSFPILFTIAKFLEICNFFAQNMLIITPIRTKIFPIFFIALFTVIPYNKNKKGRI